jgi:hypothetical protein
METTQKTYFEPISGFAIGAIIPALFKSKNPLVYLSSIIVCSGIGVLISYKKAEKELSK